MPKADAHHADVARSRHAIAATLASKEDRENDLWMGQNLQAVNNREAAHLRKKTATEEEVAVGMRQNAMEIDVADANNDKMLDFDEFCSFIQQRERGPKSAFELRSRFNALDADGSGKIDMHELIRFSLRDALARASARVIDLLREWDADGNVRCAVLLASTPMP